MRGYHIRIALSPGPGHKSTDAFIPSSLFQPLPAQRPKPTARKNAIFNPKGKDYRLGPLRIDWVDFEDMSKATYSAASTSSRKGRDQAKGAAEATFVPKLHSKSGFTNLPEGIVHVFRDSADGNAENDGGSLGDMADSTDISTDGLMLGVLAVPSWMTPSDFLGFIAPATEGLAHLRIIRDSAPNRSMAIIKFFDSVHALQFAEEFNGKQFSSLQPEICNVVHVLSVKFDASDHVSQNIARFGSAQGSVFELPTCPVCLERMDSAVTGLITVPCSHTFHCACLSKWGDSRCPVCRYSQTLLSSHPSSSTSGRSAIPFANPAANTLSACVDCSSTTNLWICLICGNIGCGRYGRAHAQAHYQATTHLYALELETQRVWDYAGDGYVHRLIQNKADGKLVELPSAASSMGLTPREGGLGPSQADALSAEKIEAIGIEYSYLLTSQLDSQREYYEHQTVELSRELEEHKTLVDGLKRELEKERNAAKAEEARWRQEEEQRISEVVAQQKKAEQKAEKVTLLARTLQKELEEERMQTKGLVQNVGKMKEMVAIYEKDKEELQVQINDLTDQVRDVMFFLDAKKKIETGDGAGAEAAGGSLEIPRAPTPTPSSTSAKKKKKSRKA